MMQPGNQLRQRNGLQFYFHHGNLKRLVWRGGPGRLHVDDICLNTGLAGQSVQKRKQREVAGSLMNFCLDSIDLFANQIIFSRKAGNLFHLLPVDINRLRQFFPMSENR